MCAAFTLAGVRLSLLPFRTVIWAEPRGACHKFIGGKEKQALQGWGTYRAAGADGQHLAHMLWGQLIQPNGNEASDHVPDHLVQEPGSSDVYAQAIRDFDDIAGLHMLDHALRLAAVAAHAGKLEEVMQANKLRSTLSDNKHAKH